MQIAGSSLGATLMRLKTPISLITVLVSPCNHDNDDHFVLVYQQYSHLLPKLRMSDILIAFGDHGMTATGDHGGDGEAEVDAAFFAYSPRSFPHAPLTGIGSDGTFKAPLPIVEQVNLVPTLAALSGVPIPFSNLGIVLTELLSSDIASLVNSNFKQVCKYKLLYNAFSTPANSFNHM